MWQAERSDANVRWIVLGGIGLLLALALVLVAVSFFEGSVTGLPVTVARPSDLASVDAREGVQFAAYRDAAMQHLHSYGWVDRSAGRVHIPIERAIDLVAERGAR